MTDRELLVHIYGMVWGEGIGNTLIQKAHIKAAIEDHFKAAPTGERLALEDRVRTLERIVTSKGYSLTEEIEALETT